MGIMQVRKAIHLERISFQEEELEQYLYGCLETRELSKVGSQYVNSNANFHGSLPAGII